MEDDNLTCQICLEKYDQHNPNKFPKKVLCCGQIFCLNCIESIYKRNSNQFLCPLCRKVTNIPPTQLETVTSIFESFVSCPNCNGRITKNDLYINFETMSLKCIKCQQEDMSLATFLPDLVNDLSSFIKGIKRNNMNLFQLIELKVKQNLDDFFIKLKQELASKLRDIFYSEIKSKLQYDIINDVRSYKQNLDKLFNSYTVMNNFLYNTANFNVNTLKNEIQYYLQNMEKIREESTKYNSVFKLIDTQSTLFTLRNDIKDTEVQSFLLNIFETVLSDHKSDSLYTRNQSLRFADRGNIYRIGKYYNQSLPFADKGHKYKKNEKVYTGIEGYYLKKVSTRINGYYPQIRCTTTKKEKVLIDNKVPEDITISKPIISSEINAKEPTIDLSKIETQKQKQSTIAGGISNLPYNETLIDMTSKPIDSEIELKRVSIPHPCEIKVKIGNGINAKSVRPDLIGITSLDVNDPINLCKIDPEKMKEINVKIPTEILGKVKGKEQKQDIELISPNLEIEKPSVILNMQPLSQIKNFEQSMKIKTDEQPQKKEENTHQDTNKKHTVYDIKYLYPFGSVEQKNFSIFY